MIDKKGLLFQYFVLTPHKSHAYGRASRYAMLTYADFIEDHDPQLARELRDWIHHIADKLPREDEANDN